MRDLLIIGLILAASLYALRRPWVGAILWTHISLMSPHVEFGYSAADWPVGTIVAVATLTGLLFTRERHNPLGSAPMLLLLMFTAWVTATLPASIYLDQSLPLWLRSMKIFLMLFVTAALLDTRRKLDWFVWACVLSIGYYGVKGGLFTLVTAGNYRVWGPGGFIEGNNELALAVITIIPLMRYLQLQMHRRWAVHAMSAAMALCAITALGTYSRGALVGLAAMALVLWAKSRNKISWGLLLMAFGVVALSFMPEQWWERMDTIQSYDRDDSALGRINAWWNAFNLAKDRFFGGGFMIYTPEVFARYSPEPDRVHAAHSIYFQVLGEHGWVGLVLFLSIGLLTWLRAGKLMALGRADPRQRWAADLGAMAQVSMAAFATGGAFLSLAYFDLPYNVMVMVVLALQIAHRHAGQPAAAAVAVAGAR
jgi:putative inorganic carbon (hco3(-)) transporter